MNIKLIFSTLLLLQSLVFNPHKTSTFELSEVCSFNNNPKKHATKREISITLESVLMLSNNHVGDDWQHFLSINDQVIFKGESLNLTLETRAPLRIEANSVEEDKDYPDTGINQMRWFTKSGHFFKIV